MKERTRLQGGDWILWGILGCTLVGTFHAEYTLATATEVHPVVALAVPGALDLYVIRALRVHRDVLPAVLVMVAANVASHLVTAQVLEVGWALISAVGALTPALLWRVHYLWHENARAQAASAVQVQSEVQEAGAVSASEETAPATSAPQDWDEAWAAEWSAMTSAPGAAPVAAAPSDQSAGALADDEYLAPVIALPPGWNAAPVHPTLKESDVKHLPSLRAYLDTCAEEESKPSGRGLAKFAGVSQEGAGRLLRYAAFVESTGEDL